MDERGEPRAPPYLSGGRVDFLAAAALVGVDPVALIVADAPLRHVLEDVTQRALARAIERDDRLARSIIVELADALNRSK